MDCPIDNTAFARWSNCGSSLCFLSVLSLKGFLILHWYHIDSASYLDDYFSAKVGYSNENLYFQHYFYEYWEDFNYLSDNYRLIDLRAFELVHSPKNEGH